MIPIFIITCDRLKVLKESMRSYYDCIKTPFKIVILDQGSTYGPTIEFLDNLELVGIKVYRWKKGLNDSSRRNLRRDNDKIAGDIRHYFRSHLPSNYVVTDPDILLDNVDGDILEVYAYLLEKLPKIMTVGTMLRTDDVPDFYFNKKAVLLTQEYAGIFTKKVNTIQYKGSAIKYISTPIHTTFGMYRSETLWTGFARKAIRTFAPYSAKHLDWYLNPEELTEDQKYYMEHASSNLHWGKPGHRAKGKPK